MNSEQAVVSSQPGPVVSEFQVSRVAILAFYFGVFGVHRFYVGKIGTGLLQLFTLGGLGLWALIDQFILAWGAFTDSKGNRVSRWT